MQRRTFLASSLAARAALAASAAAPATPPNVVIILADDQGYGDLGCYGSPDIRTPNIDRMAREGMRMTSFYSAPLCGPSRAALMTGCYGPRVGMNTNLSPKARLGLHPRETTLGSLVKPLGYATMCIGKWHLGDRPQFLPRHRGFDSYYGLPYSNDMWPFHPKTSPTDHEDPRLTSARKRAAYTGYAGSESYYAPDKGFPDLPLIENEEVITLNPDETQLTSSYTDRALRFIRENRSRPFLLYLAHNMPHCPLFPGKRFAGKSRRGLYGDAVEEIDWSAGEILNVLASLGLRERTLVIYTSDNGPWLEYGIDGGSAGPFRAGKGTSWEGGVRAPGIFYWPGVIPSGQVSSEYAATIDILPTIADIAGAPAPRLPIDGRSMLPLLKGTAGARSPRAEHYYFNARPFDAPPGLEGVRRGPWKLRFAREAGPLKPDGLYHLEEDIAERFDRSKLNPGLVEDLRANAQGFYDRLGKEIRPLDIAQGD